MIYGICSVCTLAVQSIVCPGQTLTHSGHDLAVLHVSLAIQLHGVYIYGAVIRLLLGVKCFQK